MNAMPTSSSNALQGEKLRGAYSSKDKIPKGYKGGEITNFSPDMMRLFKSMFPHLSPDSFLSKIAVGDQEAFAEMEAPALKQFNELQGGLASRFSGMGLGGRHSSGFQNQSNQAAQDFAGQLQSQRTGMRTQALESLMNMSNQLLGQRPKEKIITEKPKKWWQNAATGFSSGLGEGLGKAIPSMFGGG